MSDPADLSDRLPPFGFQKKTIRWIGFTALASILTPTLVIGGFLGFLLLSREAPPDPDPDCVAEGIVRVAIGDRSLIVPAELRFGIGGHEPHISSLDDYCRYSNSTFVNGTALYFDKVFPDLEADIGASWSPPVQIVVRRDSMPRSPGPLEFEWIQHRLTADDLRRIQTEPSAEFVGIAINNSATMTYFSTRGELATPSGDPLTFTCWPGETVTSRGVNLGRLCSTSYIWPEPDYLSYRFLNGPYPTSVWGALDQEIRAFVVSMTVQTER